MLTHTCRYCFVGLVCVDEEEGVWLDRQSGEACPAPHAPRRFHKPRKEQG